MLRWKIVWLSLLCSSSFAQQNSSNMELALAEAPVQELSTTAFSPDKSPWQMSLGSENYSYELDQRRLGAQAPVVSYNWVGAIYNLNSRWAIELRQHFQYATNKENLSGRDKVLHRDNMEVAETMLRVAAKNWSLWGSRPGLFEFRYYAPTDRAAQLNKEPGRLRANVYTEWALNSKWSLASWISPRVQLNSSANPNTQIGADAEYYQLKAAPYVNYYFNDNVSAYYACTFNEKYSQAQRGNWTPDLANVSAHEMGLYLGLGSFLLNPSLVSEADLNNSDGSLLTRESRVFSYETLSYNFNIYATF